MSSNMNRLRFNYNFFLFTSYHNLLDSFTTFNVTFKNKKDVLCWGKYWGIFCSLDKIMVMSILNLK